MAGRPIRADQGRLILASASPRRRMLLRQAGVQFTVRPSRWEEGRPEGSPVRFARLTALAKALDVARRTRGPAWVLGADTLVVQGRRVFGKPASRSEARGMLRALAGRAHRVLTGVALVPSGSGRSVSWTQTTWVRMRPVSVAELRRYLDTGEWRGKAGGYGIQGRAGAFVTRVAGCYFNVVGLPLGRLTRELARRRIGLR